MVVAHYREKEESVGKASAAPKSQEGAALSILAQEDCLKLLSSELWRTLQPVSSGAEDATSLQFRREKPSLHRHHCLVTKSSLLLSCSQMPA